MDKGGHLPRVHSRGLTGVGFEPSASPGRMSFPLHPTSSFIIDSWLPHSWAGAGGLTHTVTSGPRTRVCNHLPAPGLLSQASGSPSICVTGHFIHLYGLLPWPCLIDLAHIECANPNPNLYSNTIKNVLTLR